VRIVRHAQSTGKPDGLLRFLIDNLDQPVKLNVFQVPHRPDLATDRSVLSRNLKPSRPGVPIAVLHLGPGRASHRKNQEQAYPFSRCISSAAAWRLPPVQRRYRLRGAADHRAVRLFNTILRQSVQHERLAALMGDGASGIGYAQNCVEVA